MSRNYFLVIVGIALVCLFLIFYSLGKKIEGPVTKEPIPPPLSPYKSYISGTGVVEPSSGVISVGIPVNRIVKKVNVQVGDNVKKGEVFLSLEDQDLQANLAVQETAYKSALAQLQRLEAFPRSEDLAAAKAELQSANTELNLAKVQYQMTEALPDPRSISKEEKNRRYFNYLQAEAKWQQARANLEKTQSGAWKPDLEIARLQVDQAKANVDHIKAEMERNLIRSPIDGTVLQIKIHDGESPPLDTLRSPILIVGDINNLFLRVSINQLDVPFFHMDAPAIAFLEGDSRVEVPLEFVRIEPLLVSKQNFTNDIAERIDTKVLHIIYRIKKTDPRVFVGEQMDTFIKTKFPS